MVISCHSVYHLLFHPSQYIAPKTEAAHFGVLKRLKKASSEKKWEKKNAVDPCKFSQVLLLSACWSNFFKALSHTVGLSLHLQKKWSVQWNLIELPQSALYPPFPVGNIWKDVKLLPYLHRFWICDQIQECSNGLNKSPLTRWMGSTTYSNYRNYWVSFSYVPVVWSWNLIKSTLKFWIKFQVGHFTIHFKNRRYLLGKE